MTLEERVAQLEKRVVLLENKKPQYVEPPRFGPSYITQTEFRNNPGEALETAKTREVAVLDDQLEHLRLVIVRNLAPLSEDE